MTKQEILEYFKDINHAYNESTRLDDLSHMLDELIQSNSDEDYISREWVLEHQRIVVDDDGIMLPVVDVSIVKKAPSIQSKAKMGHWIYRVVGICRYVSCSECNKMQVDKSNYCPNCGVRMEKDGTRFILYR